MKEAVPLLATVREVITAIEEANFDYLDLLTPHLKQEAAELEAQYNLTEVVANEVVLYGRRTRHTPPGVARV